MSDHVNCPQCMGYGCSWCNQKGTVTIDRAREINRENRQMDDDRDWARERDRRSGAYSG